MRTSLRQNAHLLAALTRCALDPTRPVVAHLIVTRRCNLTCGYCREHDQVSPPVPTAALEQRIDHLATLGTAIVVLTGGESLLHSDIAHLVAYVRDRGLTPALNTNGYLLNEGVIEAFNRAGLYAMQMSVDNVTPNEVTKKSLKSVRGKLELLAHHARFRVRVNTVVGSSPLSEAVTVTQVVNALGLEAKASLLRGDDGQLVQLGRSGRDAYDAIRALDPKDGGLSPRFQEQLLAKGHTRLKCRAGARFFHVCENGLVHYCEHKYGTPGVPLATYTKALVARSFHIRKPCAAKCPIVYAHQASALDAWRSQAA